MIKNIIFDIGNVLLNFDYHPYIKGLLKDDDVIEHVNNAISLGIEGPYTSWWHMFGWNVFGLLLMGPAVATYRFFDTLNKVEAELNKAQEPEARCC